MPECHVCGEEVAESARFCASCGAALTAPEERREERKVVTVLFADLVGFTSRAEMLDPEDVRAVLAPYWERLRSELEHKGGTVEKFIGDAVMAVFGAPVAHEDDALRAVRAALAIRDWVRDEDDMQVRIAINTGEALVLLGARPAEGEGMVAGDVVNTTARMQTAAPVNGILVGETTYRATRDAIEYSEHDPIVAKGKAEPVAVWEVVHARSRFGMDLELGSSLPLVGRARELDTLLAAFERARTEREPQLVTLVGVPGIGKSRLVAELFARLDALPDQLRWRQGRTLPYGQGVSFWALGEMVKAQAGIHENDARDEAEEKLRMSVASAVEESDRQRIVQHLLPLVGLEQAQELGDRRDERFAAWRRYLEGIAEQLPLILVFEDLHWADDGLLDFVDHLADWATGVPLVLLGTARPELLDRRPGWGGGKLNAATVALTPLADDDAARIIAAVLDQALLPAETQQALLERAGGNPLYAEQFARLHVERGSTEDLPETIQGIIAARLDGLAADEKRLLQDAAVVGKVFWAGAAAELSGLDDVAVEQAVHSLERKGLVRRERRSAVEGENELAFRHVLVRDVAYGQIPRAVRAEKHARASDWIERLGRAEDHAELVAHHYASAIELAGAAGTADAQLVARARAAFARAGDRALRLNAFDAAKQFYADALALDPGDGERPYLLLGHAQARYHADGAADAELAEAIEELGRIGDVEAAAQATALASEGAWRGGRHAEAREHLLTARAMLGGRPPSRALVTVLAETARLDVFAGRLDEGLSVSEEAIRLAEELGLDDLRASVLTTRGTAKIMQGEIAEAEALLQEAVDLVSSTGSPEAARALVNLAAQASMTGDRAAVRERTERAAEYARRIGDRRTLLWLDPYFIRGAFFDGDWDQALTRTAAYLDAVEALGGHYSERGIVLLRALTLGARGDTSSAARDLERGLEGAEALIDRQVTIPTYLLAATVSLLLGDESRATELLEEATVLTRAAHHRAPAISAELVVMIVHLGRADEWLEAFADAADTQRMRAVRLTLEGRTVEAADEWARLSGPTDEAAVRLLAARQLAEAGKQAEAEVQLERALAFYRAVGATRIVAEAEALSSSRSTDSAFSL
ncbi:MAG TPA: adenylate/guanylate cyclase domain-containing protein [Gaiellaceae bacterium]|nr:adenylate/guanylate cyclase domain-containing protein [Gaiellaceae bacterium]